MSKIFDRELSGDAFKNRSFSEYESQEKHEDYERLTSQLHQLIKEEFPSLAQYFDTPDLERVKKNYEFIYRLDFGKADPQVDVTSREFLSVVGVRYIDNFIDEVYWPHVVMQAPPFSVEAEQQEEKLKSFLLKAEDVIRNFDPYFAPEIKELPLVELRLALHPDQETFTREVENYVRRKSYNLAYLKHLGYRKMSQSEALWSELELNENLLLAIWDIGRDLEYGQWEKDDFNIFKHIHKYNLDPAVFIDLIKSIVQKAAPTVFESFEKSDFIFMDEGFQEELRGRIEDDKLSSEKAFFVGSAFRTLDMLINNPSKYYTPEE